jgi:hypothetical protein
MPEKSTVSDQRQSQKIRKKNDLPGNLASKLPILLFVIRPP